MKNYENVTIFNHPLINHKVAILRDEKTSMKEFRELVEEITTLMTYECLKEGVPTVEREFFTELRCPSAMAGGTFSTASTSGLSMRSMNWRT